MSLINDALRKAQKQRTGEAVPLAALPSVGGESAARIHKRGKPAGFYTLLLRLGLGAGGLAVLVIGGYFAFRQAPENKAQQTESSASPTTAIPARPEPSPVVRPPSSEPTALPAVAQQTAGQTPAGPQAGTVPTTFTLPLAGHVAPSAPVAAPSSQLPARSSQLPAHSPQLAAPSSQPSAPSSQLPAPSSPPPKMEGRAINFIENLRIAGIRASATDAKVLMNDRVYRINDIVEHELNLKLVGITASSLTFENEHGARYTRSF